MKTLNLFLISFLLLCTATAQIPSGSVLWLKADAGVTTSGSNVTAWADQSGNGNNVSQATAANQPTLETNFFGTNPGILFNGTKFLNNTVANIPSGARTIIMVVKGTCASNTFYLFTDRRSNAMNAYQLSTANKKL